MDRSHVCNQCAEQVPHLDSWGKCPDEERCLAVKATKEARAAGMKPEWDPDMPGEEILSGIKVAGFGAYLETKYHRGAGYRGRRQSEWWFPIWAIQAASDAMDNGDNVADAVRAYYQVVREIPEDQLQASMLASQGLLDTRSEG